LGSIKEEEKLMHEEVYILPIPTIKEESSRQDEAANNLIPSKPYINVKDLSVETGKLDNIKKHFFINCTVKGKK
jgi:hypothetical protein